MAFGTVIFVNLYYKINKSYYMAPEVVSATYNEKCDV